MVIDARIGGRLSAAHVTEWPESSDSAGQFGFEKIETLCCELFLRFLLFVLVTDIVAEM